MPFPGPEDKYPFEERQHIHQIVTDADYFLIPSPHDRAPTSGGGHLWHKQHLCTDGDFCVSLPVARAIVQLFGNRVMGQGIVIDCEDENAEKWLLDNMRDTNFNVEMTSTLEMASAYGGAYVQVIQADSPYVQTYKPNMVSPVWRAGQLNEATIVTPLGLAEDQETEFRLYENHYMASDLGGVIIDYIVYKSRDHDKAGRPADMDEIPMFPELLPILSLPRLDGTTPIFRRFISGLTTLDIKYVPNILPNYDALMPNEGRSDIAPLFDMLGFLDLVLSVTADAIDKGRMTLFVAEELMESELGRQWFRANNLLVPVSGGPVDMGEGTGIQQVEFQLQVTERIQLASNLKSFIYEQAGVSPQSLGINVAGINESGIAKEVRERTTKDSVQRKRQSATEPLRKVLDTMLVFGSFPGVDIDIRFPTQNILTDKELADTAIILRQGGLMDRAEAIKYIFPNLSQQEVNKRVAAIEAEERKNGLMDGVVSGNQMVAETEIRDRPGEPQRT